MATFYGTQSKYLVWNKKISKIAALMWLILLTLSIIYVITRWTFDLFSIPSFIVYAVLFGPSIIFIDHQLKQERSLLYRFSSGLHGEGAIWYELHKLGSDYLVFQDVKIPGHKENIDFVVIGPTGLFTIEVKNHAGFIGFNGDELIRNGQLFEKNMLKQSMNQALLLHDYLLSSTNVDIFVSPILVFSNSFARVHFGHHCVKMVKIIQRRWLVNEIVERPKRDNPNQVIVEALRSLI